jgi:hypothetical protein
VSDAREEANDREVYVGGRQGTTTEADLRRFIEQLVPDVRIAGVHLVRNNRGTRAGRSQSARGFRRPKITPIEAGHHAGGPVIRALLRATKPTLSSLGRGYINPHPHK